MKEILTPSGDTTNFLQKRGDLYNFWFDLLFDSINLDNFKSQQIKFLKDLMNEFEAYKKFKKSKEYDAGGLYLLLLRNQKYTVNDIFLNNLTGKYNRKIYLLVKILFDLREHIFKKLFNKGIIKRDSDQPDK